MPVLLACKLVQGAVQVALVLLQYMLLGEAVHLVLVLM
jgi:hypothetical protein